MRTNRTALPLLATLLLGCSSLLRAAEVTLETKQASGSSQKVGLPYGNCPSGCEVKYFRAYTRGGYLKSVADSSYQDENGSFTCHQETTSANTYSEYIGSVYNAATCTHSVTITTNANGFYRNSVSYNPSRGDSYYCESTDPNSPCSPMCTPAVPDMITLLSTNYTSTDACGNQLSIALVKSKMSDAAEAAYGYKRKYLLSQMTITSTADQFADEHTTEDIIREARACAENALRSASYARAMAASCSLTLASDQSSATYAKAKWRLAIRGSKKGQKVIVTLISRITINGQAQEPTETVLELDGRDDELWYYEGPDLEPQTKAECGYSYSKTLELGCSN